MTRVLILHYSQSGETARVADAFASKLGSSGVELTLEEVRPRADYPYPWKTVRRFFDAMPECILGLPPQIEPPDFDPHSKFDLVLLVYPVWFLSPALPIQGVFNSSHAAVLQGADVITVSVSRAMWQNASLTTKRLLAASGAVHRDNIVVTHQGSPIATLISTPRALLFGKRDRLMGVFPKAGISKSDMKRVKRLAAALAEQLRADRRISAVQIAGAPSVSVNRWLVIPELIAWYCFYAWGWVAHQLGRVHSGLRALGVYGFVLFLFCLILIGLPIAMAGTWLAYPLIKHRLRTYMERLAAPASLK